MEAVDTVRSFVTKLSLSEAYLIHRHVLCNCKSGPMAVLFIKASNGLLQELGRTEVVFNSSSPKWIRKFTVTYQFETVQNLVFHVYDVDTQFHGLNVKALKLEEQQFLGEASCTLSEIATKVDGTSTLNLALEEVSSPARTRHSGQLTIYAEESVALDTKAAETGEKLSIPMSARQNHQDELLVDNYSETNQHTVDLNPVVPIDIHGEGPGSERNPRLGSELELVPTTVDWPPVTSGKLQSIIYCCNSKLIGDFILIRTDC